MDTFDWAQWRDREFQRTDAEHFMARASGAPADLLREVGEDKVRARDPLPPFRNRIPYESGEHYRDYFRGRLNIIWAMRRAATKLGVEPEYWESLWHVDYVPEPPPKYKGARTWELFDDGAKLDVSLACTMELMYGAELTAEEIHARVLARVDGWESDVDSVRRTLSRHPERFESAGNGKYRATRRHLVSTYLEAK